MGTEPSYRRGVALLVGISEYLHAGQIPALQFAHRDARALARTLNDPAVCNFPQGQVHLVTNRKAKRGRLARLLSEWLPEQARGQEIVVLYFAGHGTVQQVGGREEGFLLP